MGRKQERAFALRQSLNRLERIERAAIKRPFFIAFRLNLTTVHEPKKLVRYDEMPAEQASAERLTPLLSASHVVPII
jgi:hypothetical protein